MPTIPLYSPTEDLDASHHVRAPGGFEWWHFDAEDSTSSTRVVVDVYDGHLFDRAYWKACKKYAKSPTRNPPPIPKQFPAAELMVFRGDRVVSLGTQSLADVMALGNDGSVLLNIGDANVSAELHFEPVAKVAGRWLLHSDHHWFLPAAGYDIRGTVTIDGKPTSFAGKGYHDHYFGLSPVIATVDDWFHGRLLLNDGILAFKQLSLVDGGQAAIRLVHATGKGVRNLEITQAGMTRQNGTPWRVGYPLEVTMSDTFKLSRPRVLEANRWSAYLTYEATFNGEEGVAFCRFVCPRRLR